MKRRPSHVERHRLGDAVLCYHLRQHLSEIPSCHLQVPVYRFDVLQVVSEGDDLIVGHHFQPLPQVQARAKGRDDVDPGHIQVDIGEGLGQHRALPQVGEARMGKIEADLGEGPH